MGVYINSLIAVIVTCQIVLRLSPDKDNTKKYVRLICSLAVLLTMISPLKSIILSVDDVRAHITEFFTAGEAEKSPADSFAPAAATLLSYVEENFPAAGEDISLTFVTDESDAITEVQIFLPESDARTCGEIESTLGRELSVTVRVFAGG